MTDVSTLFRYIDKMGMFSIMLAILIALSVCIIAFFRAAELSWATLRQPELDKIVCILTTGSDGTIRIIARRDPGGDTGPSLFYEIWKENTRVYGPEYFGVSYRPLDSSVFNSFIIEDGNIIGVSTDVDPKLLVVVYDYQSQRGWPSRRRGNETTFDDLSRFRKELGDRIRAASNDGRYDVKWFSDIRP